MIGVCPEVVGASPKPLRRAVACRVAISVMLLFAEAGVAAAGLGTAEGLKERPELQVATAGREHGEVMLGSGPYCGVHSLAACLNAVGINASVRELVHPKYVSSDRGSTADDLALAASDYGARATCFRNLGYEQLLEVKSPMLLHFRTFRGSPSANHWVAFLGVRDGRVRILDIPNSLQELEPLLLLALWDGVGIQIESQQSPRKGLSTTQAAMSAILYAIDVVLLLLAALLLGEWITTRIARHPPAGLPAVLRRRGAVSAMLVLVLAVCGSLLFHLLSPIGFFRGRPVVAEVLNRYGHPAIQEVDRRFVAAAIRDRSSVLVDARRSRDFERQAIPAAINLPIDSSPGDRERVLRDVQKSASVVVYCRSSHCQWADHVAAYLSYRGYRQVYIYRDGYVGWMSEERGRDTE